MIINIWLGGWMVPKHWWQWTIRYDVRMVDKGWNIRGSLVITLPKPWVVENMETIMLWLWGIINLHFILCTFGDSYLWYQRKKIWFILQIESTLEHWCSRWFFNNGEEKWVVSVEGGWERESTGAGMEYCACNILFIYCRRCVMFYSLC